MTNPDSIVAKIRALPGCEGARVKVARMVPVTIEVTRVDPSQANRASCIVRSCVAVERLFVNGVEYLEGRIVKVKTPLDVRVVDPAMNTDREVARAQLRAISGTEDA